MKVARCVLRGPFLSNGEWLLDRIVCRIAIFVDLVLMMVSGIVNIVIDVRMALLCHAKTAVRNPPIQHVPERYFGGGLNGYLILLFSDTV